MRFSHYVPQVALALAQAHGVPAVAMCGLVWHPTELDPALPDCPVCVARYHALPDPQEGEPYRFDFEVRLSIDPDDPDLPDDCTCDTNPERAAGVPAVDLLSASDRDALATARAEGVRAERSLIMSGLRAQADRIEAAVAPVPAPRTSSLIDLLGDVPVWFWQCPVAAHAERRGVTTVVWYAATGHCTYPRCRNTSADRNTSQEVDQ